MSGTGAVSGGGAVSEGGREGEEKGGKEGMRGRKRE